MSSTTTRLGAAVLAAALGGTLLAHAPAAAAGTAAPAAPATARLGPSPVVAPVVAPAVSSVVSSALSSASAAADFGYVISFPKHVRRGGSLVYTVKIKNRKARGQHYVMLTGAFSTRFRKIKVISKPRSVSCSVKRRTLSCWITSLDRGDSTAVRIRAWAGSRRGTAAVRFGAIATSDAKADRGRLAKQVRRTIKADTRVR
ncbi:hypothetical protein [Streptosporangium sp. NPDC023615]|uniref:hypothetical protein n=1 Tax=Streptosporangium sp. NPDC023615 TaxID=3154794 RepID=UPI00344881E0